VGGSLEDAEVVPQNSSPLQWNLVGDQSHQNWLISTFDFTLGSNSPGMLHKLWSTFLDTEIKPL
jgi:hypothetical protein